MVILCLISKSVYKYDQRHKINLELHLVRQILLQLFVNVYYSSKKYLSAVNVTIIKAFGCV